MAEPGALALYLGLGIFASLLLASGLLAMKSRAAHLPAARGRAILRAVIAWVSDPVWSAGLGVQVIGYAIYIVALGKAPVSLVAVMMQAGIALFVAFAVIFLHERASMREWFGIGGIAAATVMMGLTLGSGAPQGHAEPPAIYLLTAAAILAATIPAAIPRVRHGGAATAIAAGAAFGLGSVCTKPLADGIF
jgi:drug/metabolite transporter (DMT)-like permease